MTGLPIKNSTWPDASEALDTAEFWTSLMLGHYNTGIWVTLEIRLPGGYNNAGLV